MLTTISHSSCDQKIQESPAQDEGRTGNGFSHRDHGRDGEETGTSSSAGAGPAFLTKTIWEHIPCKCSFFKGTITHINVVFFLNPIEV